MKKVVFILILIISLLIINNLVRSIYSLWNKQALLVNAKSQLDDEKKKHAQLQQQLAQVKNPLFVEQEARNKLFLMKPGEKVILLEQEEKKQGVKQVPSKKVEPNWQQWMHLFF